MTRLLKIAVLSCFVLSRCICDAADQIIENTQFNRTSTQNDTDEPHKLVQCIPQNGTAEVRLVNDTELIQACLPKHDIILSRDVPANCLLVLFYSRHCLFSSMAAPPFNALPRAFPGIKMLALDAMTYRKFNVHKGIVAVPTLLLFHDGMIVAKFNESHYTLEAFSKFLTKQTGIVAAPDKAYLTSADFTGPVHSVPTKDFDAFLVNSWLFIVICSVYYFIKSRFWKWIVDTVQSCWRESEVQAQHEHDN